jgi:hypothetical protein
MWLPRVAVGAVQLRRFARCSMRPRGGRGSCRAAFAKHQSLTDMVDAVRALTLGKHAQALLGHPASYYVARSLVWAAALLVVAVRLAVARYRRG